MSNSRLLQVIERFATVGGEAVADSVALTLNPAAPVSAASNTLPQLPQLPQRKVVEAGGAVTNGGSKHEPVVMHWDIHAAGLATGALVLCEDCREFTLGAVPVGDGNCALHGPVFARCPFDCREYHARKRPWS